MVFSGGLCAGNSDGEINSAKTTVLKRKIRGGWLGEPESFKSTAVNFFPGVVKLEKGNKNVCTRC